MDIDPSVSRLRQNINWRTEPSQRTLQGQQQYRTKFRQGFNSNYQQKRQADSDRVTGPKMQRINTLNQRWALTHIVTFVHAYYYYLCAKQRKHEVEHVVRHNNSVH